MCVSVCSPAFYSAVDNMSSPSPQSEKVENHAVCVCVCVHYIHLRSGNGGVNVCGERKGWRLYVCACVSFFSSLSECLFLDRFEGQGLATGGEKLCSHLKGKKKLLLSPHNEKKSEHTSTP